MPEATVKQPPMIHINMILYDSWSGLILIMQISCKLFIIGSLAGVGLLALVDRGETTLALNRGMSFVELRCEALS